MTVSSMLLKDLLVATKDGDWGKEAPTADHSLRYVIRGADFPDVPHRKVDKLPMRYLPDRTVDRRTLEAGDILLETAGGTRGRPTGRTVLVTQELLDAIPGKVIGASFTRFLRVNEALVDSRYLYWYLTAIYHRGEMAEYHVQHTGVGRFQYTIFAANKQIPLLPLEQQRSIAEVLGALDDKIAANDRALLLMDELVRATFVGLEGEPRQLGSIASNVRAQVDPTQIDPNTPYVGLEHVPRRRMWLTEAETAAQVTSAKTAFAKGDVLFGKLRPYFHKVVGAPLDGIASTDILALRALDPSLAGLVLAVASSDAAITATTSASEGTRMPRTKWVDLAAVEFSWPGDEAAREFSSMVSELAALAAGLAAENDRLASTRDDLLPLLMSGKVRVKDAAVEDAL